MDSPAEGILGCFQVWALTGEAAVNTYAGFWMDTNFQLVWVHTQELNLTVSVFLVVSETTKLSSKELRHSDSPWW